MKEQDRRTRADRRRRSFSWLVIGAPHRADENGQPFEATSTGPAESMTTTRKFGIAVVLLWTLVVTSLRAVRLPNAFSTEHWFVDYRFGFVKRGLVGTIVSLATRAMHMRPTEQLVAILSSLLLVVFCVALMGVGLRIVHRSGWSTTGILTVLAFVSSPFIVMSAHLIGYYDNIIIVLGLISLACLLRGRIWLAASLEAISILVHENALLIGFPVFCFGWLLVNSRRQPDRARLALWPLFLPVGTFLFITLSQSLAPRDLEQSLTTYLSSFPFIAKNIRDVRVPHWITITFFDSYALHRGFFFNRLLAPSMLGLVLPSMLAVVSFIVDAYGVRDLSLESLLLLGVCLAPQLMHLVAWDTTRIWTYSILCAFLALWVYAELFAARRDVSHFVRLLCLAALVLNSAGVTPLMDGLSDHFDFTTRLLLYAPVIGAALGLILWNEPVPIRERLSIP